MRGYYGNQALQDKRELFDISGKETKRQWGFTILFIALIIFLVAMKDGCAVSNITVQVNESAIGVSNGVDKPTFISVDDIESVEVVSTEEWRDKSSSNSDVQYSIIGNNCTEVIVVDHPGGTFSFTGRSDEDTQNIYTQILKVISRNSQI